MSVLLIIPLGCTGSSNEYEKLLDRVEEKVIEQEKYEESIEWSQLSTYESIEKMSKLTLKTNEINTIWAEIRNMQEAGKELKVKQAERMMELGTRQAKAVQRAITSSAIK